MSPLRLGMVALDAGMPLFKGIIKFAGTLGTVLGKAVGTKDTEGRGVVEVVVGRM